MTALAGVSRTTYYLDLEGVPAMKMSSGVTLQPQAEVQRDHRFQAGVPHLQERCITLAVFSGSEVVLQLADRLGKLRGSVRGCITLAEAAG